MRLALAFLLSAGVAYAGPNLASPPGRGDVRRDARRAFTLTWSIEDETPRFSLDDYWRLLSDEDRRQVISALAASVLKLDM